MTGETSVATQPHLVLLLRHALYLRNYESMVRRLDADGWRVTLATMAGSRRVDDSLARQLAASTKRVSIAELPRASGIVQDGVDSVYTALDWMRFLDANYSESPALELRARRRVPRMLQTSLHWYGVERSTRRRLTATSRLERSVSASLSNRAAVAALDALSPTVLAVTPMVDIDGGQQAYVQAALSLGIPSAVLVASWDNLSIKGLIHRVPDRVVVWNSYQADEAFRLHRVPRERIDVTGAQLFDWLRTLPAPDDGEGFLTGLSLDPDQATILYAGSSSVVGPHEWRFLSETYLPALRRYWDRRVSRANVIVRPHPNNPIVEFKVKDALAKLGAVVDPRSGEPVVDDATRRHYRALLTHSDAVVGVNTSAFVEAAIVGTPSVPVSSKKIPSSQQDAPHFRMLQQAGLFDQPRSVYGTLEVIGHSLDDPAKVQSDLGDFVERFIDPPNRNSSATQRIVTVLRELADRPAAQPEPRRRSSVLAFTLIVVLGVARAFQRLAIKGVHAGRLLFAGRDARAAARKARQAPAPKVAPAKPASHPTISRRRRRASARAVRRRNKTVLAFKIDIYRTVRGPSRKASAWRLFRRTRKLVLKTLHDIPGLATAPAPGSSVGNTVARTFYRRVSSPLLARRGSSNTKGRMARLTSDVNAALATGRQIVVGPWTSEVGFEVLYWVPFVRRLLDNAGVPPEQVTIISRGGTREWYGIEAATYRDVFDVMGSREFHDRIGNATVGKKQIRWSGPEADLVRQLAPDDAIVIHPREMYLALMPFFAGRVPTTWLSRYMQNEPMTLDEQPGPGWADVSSRLPGTYITVGLYKRPSFRTEFGDARLRAFLERIQSAGLPLVSLETGLNLDDHRPVDLSQLWISRPLLGVDPAVNLALQTRLIANSAGLVCTYGGTSYVGGALGVPTLGLYDDPARILWHHRDVARERFAGSGATYEVTDLANCDPEAFIDSFSTRKTPTAKGEVA